MRPFTCFRRRIAQRFDVPRSDLKWMRTPYSSPSSRMRWRICRKGVFDDLELKAG